MDLKQQGCYEVNCIHLACDVAYLPCHVSSHMVLTVLHMPVNSLTT
jgi:hypothetical protein